MINKKIVKYRFEKCLITYENEAVVQKNMAEKLCQIIKNVQSKDCFENVFEIGAGSGLLTYEFVSRFNYLKYVANDLFGINYNIKNIEYNIGDAGTIIFPENSDIIISNAVFQWFDDIKNMILKCKNSLKNNGILSFTTFGEDNFYEIKKCTNISLNYIKESELKAFLENNFEILHFEKTSQILYFKTPYEILNHIKKTGANSFVTKPWTKLDLRSFIETYKKNFPKINLTYEPIFIVLRKRQ